MIDELLNHTMFEMEYHHRAKSNPFSEKWINCTRSRTRIRKLKDFLYSRIKIILSLEKPQKFFQNALSQFIHRDYYEFQDLQKACTPETEEEPLYRLIYLKLTLDELFVLLTNVITWEHQAYPAILEYRIREQLEHGKKLKISEDLLQYYLRFLDVLSSNEIISLFDLDALKNTIRLDEKLIEQKPLENLYLFKDWPELNQKSFNMRFPAFKSNVEKRSSAATQIQWQKT
jgi:hypothetical protein